MNKCHRHIDMPKEHSWMSVFTEIPYNWEKDICEFYWVISRKKK
jgi:hypothetical protein